MSSNTAQSAAKSALVALLIDGENMPAAFAGSIIIRAAKYGHLTFKRVYGDASRITGWDTAPGFRVIHSGSVKNGADILLSIEAVDVSHSRDIDVFVIATSDQDFSHLVHHLRERGFKVVGLGEPKAPQAFRKACSEFHELKAKSEPDTKDMSETNRQIFQLLNAADKKEMRIITLIEKMKKEYQKQISTLKEGNKSWRTWRAYFSDFPELYDLDPKSNTACVRLKIKAA